MTLKLKMCHFIFFLLIFLVKTIIKFYTLVIIKESVVKTLKKIYNFLQKTKIRSVKRFLTKY